MQVCCCTATQLVVAVYCFAPISTLKEISIHRRKVITKNYHKGQKFAYTSNPASNGGPNLSRLASLELDFSLVSSQCAIKADNLSNLFGS